MSNIWLTLLCVAAAGILTAQSAQWQWAHSGGGQYNDRGEGLDVDSEGNCYATGCFYEAASFGEIALTNAGSFSKDTFVVKYGPEGQEIWAVNTGQEGDDGGCSLVCADSQVYVAGSFSGTVSFGGTTLTAQGTDTYIACLDAQGAWQWAIRGGGAASVTIPRRLILGPQNDLLACGYFTGTIGLGSEVLSSAGEEDIWVAKLGRNGVWHWSVRAGGLESDDCASLAPLPGGGLAVCGTVSGAAAFGTVNLSSPSLDNGFVAWLSSGANWESALSLTSQTRSCCNDLAVDAGGDIYLAGDFTDDLQCGPYQFTGHWNDVFLAKLDGGTKQFAWARTTGEISDDHSAAVEITPDGRIYWAGFFMNTVQFGDFSLTYVSSPDIFLARLDPAGNFLMAQSAGNICEDMAQDMAADAAGNVCLAGYYNGDMYFGPHYLSFHGDDEFFIAKITDTVPIQEAVLAPAETQLGNHPNPFGNGTTLSYALKENCAAAELRIYDLRGRLIRDCGPVSPTAGTHSLAWDGRDRQGSPAPAGVYLLRLATPRGIGTHRMLLIK